MKKYERTEDGEDQDQNADLNHKPQGAFLRCPPKSELIFDAMRYRFYVFNQLYVQKGKLIHVLWVSFLPSLLE